MKLKKHKKNSIMIHNNNAIDKYQKNRLDNEIRGEQIIRIFLNTRGYVDIIDSKDSNCIYFNNGKSVFQIESCLKKIPSYYKFCEYFQNNRVLSKGYFLRNAVDNVNAEEDKYIRMGIYSGLEMFRQTFLYKNKIVRMSLVFKKNGDKPGWCCTYPLYSMNIVVSYYNINNESLKQFNIMELFEYISRKDKVLENKIISSNEEVVSIVNNVCGNKDHRDFRREIYLYQDNIQKELTKTFEKIENYLEVDLEEKERLGIIKKLILKK